MTGSDVCSLDFWRDDATDEEMHDFGVLKAADPDFVPPEGLSLDALRMATQNGPSATTSE